MITIIPNWHPLFIHFPIALIVLSALCFTIALLFKSAAISKELFIVSKWCLWFAGLFAIATAYTGWLAYNSVRHDDASHIAMTLHMTWALPTAGCIVLAGLAALYFREKWGKEYLLLSFFGLSVLVSLVSITAWLGAEVVYRHGIGVISLPQGDLYEPSATNSDHHHHAHDTNQPHVHTHGPQEMEDNHAE
jgi:uncharacterized membrane protein